MGQEKTLKVAIIGCGKIADQHAHAISRIPNCEITSLCDREVLMAKQLGERIGVSKCFADSAQMLEETNPDVVHITTPPYGHFPLAKQCLEAGSHVFLEKPFTVHHEETLELLKVAEAKGLQITAGHNLQFTAEMGKMRKLIDDGFLGGKPTHIESHFSYDLGHVTYVGPLLGNPHHWVRKLPGRLLHNIISHPVAKLVEFLGDDIEEIIATAAQSATLKACKVEGVLDELRVMIRDSDGTTAYLCFSTSFKPGINELRLYGPMNSLLVDHTSGVVIPHANKAAKSYLVYVLPPLRKGRKYLRAALGNLFRILRGKLHQDFGMKETFERLYTSIQDSTPPPIPYREIELTSRIMESIFNQIYKADQPETEESNTY